MQDASTFMETFMKPRLAVLVMRLYNLKFVGNWIVAGEGIPTSISFLLEHILGSYKVGAEND